jgi:hypothetical protein
MKNLQHCANVRAWGIHHSSGPVVISQTLEVDGASKRNFNGERVNKGGIEASR